MPVVPNAALGGPGDQPWKRYVDGRLGGIERTLARYASDGTATDKGLAATVASLSKAVALLKEQQAILEAQQAQITALVAAIPVTDVSQTVQSGFGISTAWVTVASLSIPRPDGKGLVDVTASGFLRGDWTSPDSSAWPITQARLVIDGSIGPETNISGAIGDSGNDLSGAQNGSAMHARAYAPGADVTAELQVRISDWRLGPGTLFWTATQAQLAVTATFSQ